jgi:hypothetical protein
MFVRPPFRTVAGERRAYWTLVESYRTERGPRQGVAADLGGLDEAGRLGVQQAAEGKSAGASQPSLFAEEEETQPRSVEVEVSKVRVENSREFGGPQPRRRPAGQRRHRTPQTLRHEADRAPSHPVAPSGNGPPLVTSTN